MFSVLRYLPRNIYLVQISTQHTSTGTPIERLPQTRPDKLTATAQEPKSRVSEKKYGVPALVIVVGLAFVCILVLTSVRMWSPQNKVNIDTVSAISFNISLLHCVIIV